MGSVIVGRGNVLAPQDQRILSMAHHACHKASEHWAGGREKILHHHVQSPPVKNFDPLAAYAGQGEGHGATGAHDAGADVCRGDAKGRSAKLCGHSQGRSNVCTANTLTVGTEGCAAMCPVLQQRCASQGWQRVSHVAKGTTVARRFPFDSIFLVCKIEKGNVATLPWH